MLPKITRTLDTEQCSSRFFVLLLMSAYFRIEIGLHPDFGLTALNDDDGDGVVGLYYYCHLP